MLAEGKVRTHCFPSAHVLDVSAQIPAILKGDESVGAVMLQLGVNDTKMRQTETLKRDVRTASQVSMRCIDMKVSEDCFL